MQIEWAAGCSEAHKEGSGWDVLGLGQTGFIAQQDELPKHLVLPVFVCVRMDAGDEEGQFYDFKVDVFGPEGRQTPAIGRFESLRDSSPKLIDPERFYAVLLVEIDVTSPGAYQVVLSDATDERCVVPYHFAALPEM
jgi:hypothetical protein